MIHSAEGSGVVSNIEHGIVAYEQNMSTPTRGRETKYQWKINSNGIMHLSAITSLPMFPDNLDCRLYWMIVCSLILYGRKTAS